METKIKTVKASQVQKIELVLPNDTNILGNLLGGRLMHWIDIAAALSASRHCNSVAVTAAVDNLNFHHPIKLGDIVLLKASVNRAFSTSMEVGVKVEIENFMTGEILHSNSAYLTFVSINRETMKPQPVPPIVPESEEEKRRYEQALRRREQRLSEKHGIVH
ncbi:MAG: acyl-CoA thioesterase [Ignavibacteriae bacterium]|nr:acyl-CoA thioesterase [Ignavibacteriota bacterium]MCB0723983.1 acyl-CoA thioesterase [Ignavibacteriota bacterium]MCB9243973.1 acyl-CoA thioesterase [Ignavibacteriales bacterium]